MTVDADLVGREFDPTDPLVVTAERVAAFTAATGADGSPGPGRPVPATFPIVLAFDAMAGFLDALGLELQRIVHGDQKFRYERPVVLGDVLTARLRVSSVRSIGGNDLIGTHSRIEDADGALVCETSATLVHRGEAAP